jgi:hypothetical protein
VSRGARLLVAGGIVSRTSNSRKRGDRDWPNILDADTNIQTPTAICGRVQGPGVDPNPDYSIRDTLKH